MKNKNGYMALMATVIIAFLLMVVILTTSTSTLSKLTMITKSQESNEIKQILSSCVEDSLLKLNENGVLSDTIVIDDNSCSINLISYVDPDWEYNVNISKNGYIYSVKVKTRRTDKVYLDSLNFIQ